MDPEIIEDHRSMLKFRQWLNEVARDEPRAQKLLKDLVRRRGDDGRTRNLVPSTKSNEIPSRLSTYDLSYKGKLPDSSWETWSDLLQKHAVKKTVPVSSIVSHQQHVFPEVVSKKLKNPPSALPYVVHRRGEYFIHNGNHRVNAAILRGDKEITVKSMDADED
jgi:hypothetical protein